MKIFDEWEVKILKKLFHFLQVYYFFVIDKILIYKYKIRSLDVFQRTIIKKYIIIIINLTLGIVFSINFIKLKKLPDKASDLILHR